MIRLINKIEALVLGLLRMSETWVVTTFALSLQVIVVLFSSIIVPESAVAADIADAWINALRWQLLPGTLALYIKSILYMTALERRSDFRMHSPATLVPAALIVIAIDNIILLVIPALLNWPEYLAVLERGLAVYCFLAVSLAVFYLLFRWLLALPWVFATVALLFYAGAEYLLTWVSYSVAAGRLDFFNTLFLWSLFLPRLRSDFISVHLDPVLMYEMLGLSALFLALALTLTKLIQRKL